MVPTISAAQAFKSTLRHDELVAELTEPGTTIPTCSGVSNTQIDVHEANKWINSGWYSDTPMVESNPIR